MPWLGGVPLIRCCRDGSCCTRDFATLRQIFLHILVLRVVCRRSARCILHKDASSACVYACVLCCVVCMCVSACVDVCRSRKLGEYNAFSTRRFACPYISVFAVLSRWLLLPMCNVHRSLCVCACGCVWYSCSRQCFNICTENGKILVCYTCHFFVHSLGWLVGVLLLLFK